VTGPAVERIVGLTLEQAKAGQPLEDVLEIAAIAAARECAEIAESDDGSGGSPPGWDIAAAIRERFGLDGRDSDTTTKS